MLKTAKNLLYCIVIFILLWACKNTTKQKANPTIPPKFVQSEPIFKKEGELFFLSAQNDTLSKLDIELAETEQKRAQGLMYRKQMEANRGMLFKFNKEERQAFWMKNTFISLDIIFVDAKKEIVHIAPNTEPYSTNSIPSFEYAQYVVEVNANYCTQHNIKPGCIIKYITF